MTNHSFLYLTLAAIALAFGGLSHASSESPPWRADCSGQFELREMDMHLHSGMERQAPMKEWVDLAVADGRKVVVLLDHIELYRKTPEEFAAWREKQKLPVWYPLGFEGQKTFLDEAAAVRARKDVVTFRGWEIGEFELDEKLDVEPMKLAEVIGWHISPNSDGDAPNGESLIHRIKQILEVQKQFPVPMILFHPFSMKIEKVQKAAKKAGKDLKALTAEDYRFFKPGEQEQVAELLRGKSLYVEMAHGTQQYWDDPVARKALIADIKPLAELGVQFTVSTDAHHVPDAKKEFTPNVYCDDVGVTPQNTNRIVRELMAAREKESKKDGEWVALFDGKTLTGWESEPGIFRVEEGAIVGGSMQHGLPVNHFLCTKKTYGDFELRLKVKLKGEDPNAGIQFRSKRIPNDTEVSGYQADLGQQYWGCLYDESRRKRVLVQADAVVISKHVDKQGWNEYRIRCEGPHIELWLNGHKTVDYIEQEQGIAACGIIGLQIHAGKPSEAWYKDIQIRALKK